MIRIQELTRRFGRRTAVDRVSFACAPGTVTGFLGPNGAGKSTTLRMLTGLVPPTSGTATVDGRPYRDLSVPGRTVGVMLDAGAQHPGRTGRETLLLASMLVGASPRRVDAMLDRVGLAASGRRRVGEYSLGMRQRLGIAQALLGDPQVLVLDEPANGLDPEGIRWMRTVLRGFADGGGTVLLSSHLLHEVEATVDRLVVIGSGRLVACGALADLLRPDGVIVAGSEPARLRAALAVAGLPATGVEGGLRVQADPETVGRVARDAGLVLTQLRADTGGGLEDLFFRLTRSDPTDQVEVLA